MSKSYNKKTLLSSPNINIFNNLLDKSISFAPYFSLSFLKFISFISTSLLKSESIIFSDLASIIAPLKNISLHSAEKYITRSLNNLDYDFHHFYFKFVESLMSSFKIKHDDHKVIISLDHMYVEDHFTILMFTLRLGKSGIPLWFQEFDYHDRDAYVFPIFKDAIKTCHDLVKLNNPDAKIKFLADRCFGNHIKILDYINILSDTYDFRAKNSLLTLIMDKKEHHKIWKNLKELDSYVYKSKFYPHSIITRNYRFETNIVISPSFNHKEPLYLLTNDDMDNAVKDYMKRFSGIEFTFKNQKTNGHFLEETQIDDLYAFSNLYACLCFAQTLLTILGIDYSKNSNCYKKIKIKTTKKVKGKRIRIYSYFHVGLLIIKFVMNSIHYEYQLFKRMVNFYWAQFLISKHLLFIRFHLGLSKSVRT